MTVRTTFRLLLLQLLLVPFCASGAETPEERLGRTVDAVLDVIYGESAGETTVEQKQVAIRSVIESNFNVTIMVRRALGRNWDRLTETQQVRVRELIGDLVVKVFVDRMQQNSERPQVEYLKPKRFGDMRIEIPSVITVEGERYNVTYRFGRLEAGWEVYDILAEGVSVISNYRKQFDEHFVKGDGEGLIRKLEELLAKQEAGEELSL